MAHQVDIAKASLIGSLLRPDPKPVGREEITRFHTAIDTALLECSPANIQKCKVWILNHIAVSMGRVTALGKYLVALAESLTSDHGKEGKTRIASGSAQRRRLHILYLVNDVLHHIKYHDASSAHGTFGNTLQPHLLELVKWASSFPAKKSVKLFERIDELLDLWEDHRYFDRVYVAQLRATASAAGIARGRDGSPMSVDEQDEAAVSGAPEERAKRDAPFIMPETHGDPSTPYYDLPAANMLPFLKQDSVSKPIPTQQMKALKLRAGPADPHLITAVQTFLRAVDRIYDDNHGNGDEDWIVTDIDTLGQPIVQDKKTKELVRPVTYYGWSRDFCERMRNRRRGVAPDARLRRYSSNAISRSRSRSRSGSPRKRRRSNYSSGDEHSPPRRPARWRQSRSRSRSRSRTRSRSYDSHRSHSRSRSRPGLHSNSRPPNDDHDPRRVSTHHHPSFAPPTQFTNPNMSQTMHFPPSPPPPPVAGMGYPPRPPNYAGPWPPMPIPPPPSFGNMTPEQFQAMAAQMGMGRGVRPPPPPPPGMPPGLSPPGVSGLPPRPPPPSGSGSGYGGAGGSW